MQNLHIKNLVSSSGIWLLKEPFYMAYGVAYCTEIRLHVHEYIIYTTQKKLRIFVKIWI